MPSVLLVYLSPVNRFHITNVKQDEYKDSKDPDNAVKKDQQGIVIIIDRLRHRKRVKSLLPLNRAERIQLGHIRCEDAEDCRKNTNLQQRHDNSSGILFPSDVACSHDNQG